MKLFGTNSVRAIYRVRYIFLGVLALICLAQAAHAQIFQILSVAIEGNRRIESATIQSFTRIESGDFLGAGEVNDAVQRVRDSQLFESVSADVAGSVLKINVVEFPTVNVVVFEGNSKLKVEQLEGIVDTTSSKVYSESQVRDDANSIAAAYADQGRISASVDPRIIQRSDNRVDVVFEIVEGDVVEIERISFVGNRTFADSRLRRVLRTKQAGFLRLLLQSDTFLKDRIEFDKQVLSDFYKSRGYVDFQVLSVNSELSKNGGAFFVTFRVQEGSQFEFGKIITTSNISDVDTVDFKDFVGIKEGKVYSPDLVENTITILENKALQLGFDFIRVEPRVTRNDLDLTLDVEFVLLRGPRVFIERIDISGNSTTLDRVIRRQFKLVEGDSFNPREIRAASERIRALKLFGSVEINTREGSSPNQMVVDVSVTEKPTGSLSFGANFNSDNGLGFTASFSEANFLGRGQSTKVAITTTPQGQSLNLNFYEPAVLNRDLSLRVGLDFGRTNGSNTRYDTEPFEASAALGFPVSTTGSISVKGFYVSDLLSSVTSGSNIFKSDAAQGRRSNFGGGYNYRYDNRGTGLVSKAGTFFNFLQDFSLTGDDKFVRTKLRWGGDTYLKNEVFKLTAVLEAGALAFSSGATSRSTDRFFLNSSKMRGFSPGGVGPREIRAKAGSVTKIDEAIGGNYFAVARFETIFPSGLPEEYGIDLGTFFDVGSYWGVDASTKRSADTDPSAANRSSVIYDDFNLRAVVGFSLFWTTPIGPLRFNWTNALNPEPNDVERTFDLTVSSSF
mgnify:FL=1